MSCVRRQVFVPTVPRTGTALTPDKMAINSGNDSVSYSAPAQQEAEEKPTRQIPVTLLSGFLVRIPNTVCVTSAKRRAG
jgi:hypothetical protein